MNAAASTSKTLHEASARVHKRRADSVSVKALPEMVGSYEVVERIAVGGMAEIFKARKHGTHGFEKLVALKKILPHLANDRASVEMFLDEARITASLEHPHIIQAFELGNDADSLYFAMEYVDGLDVLHLLQDCARTQLRLPATLAALIARDVLDALDYAHEARDATGRSLGIVHRDVSPSNVLLSWTGHVKLTDFGVALAARRRHQTAQHTLRGKYGYMSPEQVNGGHLDGRSDLFSVGILLAEMAMARRLFVGSTDLDVLLAVRDVNLARLERHAAEIPAPLLAIIRRALAPAPRDRWQTAGEMRDALDSWLAVNERVSAHELAAFVTRVTSAPTAVLDHNTSSIFLRGVHPVIPAAAVTMMRAKSPIAMVRATTRRPTAQGTPSPQPIEPDDIIELDEADALELIDESDDVFNAATADGLDVEKILREGAAITARRTAVVDVPRPPRAAVRPTAEVDPATMRAYAAAATRSSAIAIDTADILLDDGDDAVEIDDRPTEQDLLAHLDLDTDVAPVPAPAPRPVVATVPRRKKQHTVETAIASLFEESQILALPPSRAARGTGRFATPHPVDVALVEDVVAPRRTRVRRPSTGVPVDEPLPLPPRRATTGVPAYEPRTPRPRRASTSLSVVAHTPVPLRSGKLGRLSSVGKLGEFANYSDSLDAAEAPPVAASPLRPAPVIAALGGTSIHATADDAEPRLGARLATPLAVLAILTAAMLAVFLLAMYGVI